MDWPTAFAYSSGIGMAALAALRVVSQLVGKPSPAAVAAGIPEHVEPAPSLEPRVARLEQATQTLAEDVTGRLARLEKTVADDIRDRRTERKKHPSGEHRAAESDLFRRMERFLDRVERDGGAP